MEQWPVKAALECREVEVSSESSRLPAFYLFCSETAAACAAPSALRRGQSSPSRGTAASLLPGTAPAAPAGSLSGGRQEGSGGRCLPSRQGRSAAAGLAGRYPPREGRAARPPAVPGGAWRGVAGPGPGVASPAGARRCGRAEGRRRAALGGRTACAGGQVSPAAEEPPAASWQLRVHMVLCQGGEGDAAPAAGGQEPEVPPGQEDGPSAVQPCPAPGVEAAGAEERRACGCCSGMSWPFCCEAPGAKKKAAKCPGLGLFYTILSAFLFSVASLFLKKIEDIHSVEVSAFRCVFQMAFVLPGLIYYKTGFLGPKGKRIFLFFRGFLGSTAMILLYYAYQVMPLADATVITFTSPVFTSFLAWIFLKEKYSLWDLLFTLFAVAGVILIARPPFLFGSHVTGIEGSYSDHLKGIIAAIASTFSAASTIVILRKVGKSVHYFLSIWYYAVIGLIGCVIALFVLNEWRLPHCGKDRFFLILIGLLGLGGQIFLTKALQIEKAGPVAIMRTMDVVFAFILQVLFLNHIPTWWTVGGALCVVASSSGTAIRKWRHSVKKAKQRAI
ncbi:solute carrier family 35 member G1 [Motacilla alba alba]|nr:solute carrier family 35 member G1 [Motacilla alba alba]